MNNYLTQKRAKIAVVVLTLVILILYGIQLYIEQSFVTKGIELGQLQTQIQDITAVNDRIRAEVIQNESYITIASKAAQMGLTQQSNNTIIIR